MNDKNLKTFEAKDEEGYVKFKAACAERKEKMGETIERLIALWTERGDDIFKIQGK